MDGLRSGVCAGALLLALGTGAACAQELPGKFAGVTIDAKLIGGQQYEALYARIPEWEAATGAKVNVIAPVAPGAAPVAKARRFDPSTLPPEVREKLAKMSPEERRAFIAARRAKAAASSPAEPAAAPASVPARASAARP